MFRKFALVGVATAIVLASASACSQIPQKPSRSSLPPASGEPLHLAKTLYSEATSPTTIARLDVRLVQSANGTVGVEATLTNLSGHAFWTSPGGLLQVTAGGQLLFGDAKKPFGTGPDLQAGESRSWSAAVRPIRGHAITVTVADWHHMVPPQNPTPGGALTAGSEPGSLSITTSVAAIPVEP